MGAVTSKVRLYDLAKELKIDTKRLIEDVRREGVDVSVPSNSISKELAERIREKYFPKKDVTLRRAVKVVKKAARPVVEEAAPPVEEEPAAPIDIPELEPIIVQEPEPVPPTPSQVVRRLAPAVRAEKPAAPTPMISQPEPAPAQTAAPAATAASEPAVAAARVEPVAAPSRQVRVLRPTAAAINAGIRPGERVPEPPPGTPSTRVRERAARSRVEYAGTPGETATPQTTYIPPPDAGRRKSRRGSTRNANRVEGKGSKFDREFIPPPPVLTLEQRIAGRLETPATSGELKAVLQAAEGGHVGKIVNGVV